MEITNIFFQWIRVSWCSMSCHVMRVEGEEGEREQLQHHLHTVQQWSGACLCITNTVKEWGWGKEVVFDGAGTKRMPLNSPFAGCRQSMNTSHMADISAPSHCPPPSYLAPGLCYICSNQNANGHEQYPICPEQCLNSPGLYRNRCPGL